MIWELSSIGKRRGRSLKEKSRLHKLLHKNNGFDIWYRPQIQKVRQQKILPQEGDDVGYDGHPTSNRDNTAHQQDNLDDNRRMTFTG